jgi:AcrR family transcriptional regulator
MPTAETASAGGARRKARYHHGDLKEAMIAAAYALVLERGPDGFAMADACAAAGVSRAAPYRHFEGREDLLKEVAIRGFGRLAASMRAAKSDHPSGSIEAIAAVGRAYVAFAMAERNIFRMIFGKAAGLKEHPEVDAAGVGAFEVLLEEIRARYPGANAERVMNAALPLWTFVHGASFLEIDGAYARFKPDQDIDTVIDAATRGLLSA